MQMYPKAAHNGEYAMLAGCLELTRFYTSGNTEIRSPARITRKRGRRTKGSLGITRTRHSRAGGNLSASLYALEGISPQPGENSTVRLNYVFKPERIDLTQAFKYRRNSLSHPDAHGCKSQLPIILLHHIK